MVPPRRGGRCAAGTRGRLWSALLITALSLLLTPTLPACSSTHSPHSSTSIAASRPIDPVQSTSDWSFAGAKGRILLTPGYRIWTTNSDAVIISRLPLFLETALHVYRTSLTPDILPAPAGTPDERLETFILSTRGQWELLTKQLMGEQAEAYLRIPRGGYASGGKAILYDIGASGTMAIAAHEGWHQYTQRTFKEGLPIWLEEGIATYMEGHRWDGATPRFFGWANIERFDHLRAASAKRDLIPLRELLDTTPQLLLTTGTRSDGALTYYSEVWALVHFLREGEGGKYRPAFEKLLADAAEGRMERTLADSLGPAPARRAVAIRRGPGVCMAYFSSDLDAMEREYDAFLATIVKTGSRQAVAEGRSPVAAPQTPSAQRN